MSKSIETEYMSIVGVEGDVEVDGGVECDGRRRTKSERRGQAVSWGQTVAAIWVSRATCYILESVVERACTY